MWNEIELLTNDDTGSGRLNIEARKESGAALYQVDTIVKISSSTTVTVCPKLHAFCSSDGCVVVVDHSVLLMDQICQSVLMQLQFDTDVDVVALCQEGQFLMVGERNGNLHLLHVKSRQTLLTNSLMKNSSEGKAYLSLTLEKEAPHSGTYYMVLLTSNGFFWISCLQLARLQQAIEMMDFDTTKALKEQIKIKYVQTEDKHTGGCNHAVINCLKNVKLLIGGTGNYVLSTWNINTLKDLEVNNVVDSSIIKGVKKCQIVGSAIFVLDDTDFLSMWDAYVFVMVWSWPTVHIQDFLLTAEGDSSAINKQGDANLKLVALTTPVNKQMRNLLVYSFPTMKLLYSLEVADVAALVQTDVGQDTIYILEGVSENQKSSPEGVISTVAMRCLTEALPENRLSRLLYKHKFEEAERFAIQFALDVELVYKVRLNIALENLASSSLEAPNPSSWQKAVDEAKADLHKVQDDQFVVKYCLDVPWPTFETTLEMLNYAKKRILKKEDKKSLGLSEVQAFWLVEVLRAEARLTTFHEAYGLEKFSGIAWIKFVNNEDLFNDVLLQLQEGNQKCAEYIWLRHQVEFENKFDLKRLQNLLDSLPASLPSQELCLWFRNVIIPFVLRIVPEGKKILVKWLEHRARSLELTEKANWPENGLQTAELYFVAKKPNELELIAAGLWIPLKKDIDCEEVYQLKTLINNLQELVDLHRKYNCRLALSEFEKETTATIVFRMLDRVLAPELIPSTLEKVIQPYIIKHNLQKEELLLHYIKDLLERCSSRSASLFETAWEAKAMAVLGCMTEIDLIFDAVLQIMYGAVVPWSDAVEQLVKQHLEKNHPKVKLLQESYRLMEMKKLLRGYGIRNFDMFNDHEIMWLVKFILKQDLPSSLDDALKVVHAYLLSPVEVYFLHLKNLASIDKRDDSLSLLKSLTLNEAEATIMRLATWAQLKTQNQSDDPEWKKHLVSIAKTVVEIIKFLLRNQKGNTLQKEACENLLNKFETIANLQEYFDVFISLKEYENPKVLLQLFEEQVQAYASMRSNSKPEKDPGWTGGLNTNVKIPTETKPYKLSLLFQNSEQDVVSKLALSVLSDGNIGEAVNICSELYGQHKNVQTGQVLFHVAQKLSQMLETNVPMIIPTGMNLPAVIYELACQAVTICSTDLLLDCEELCKSTRAAMDVYRQCLIDDYGFRTKMTTLETDKDPYDEWTFEDFFTEDGIVLDHLSVMPVMYEITTSFVPYSPDKKLYPLDCIGLPMSPGVEGENPLKPVSTPMTILLQNLQEYSQLQLALQLTINSFGNCHQHFVSNNMNSDLSKKLFEGQDLKDVKDFVIDIGNMAFSIVKKNSQALLHKLFNCRVVDTDLALAYCTLLPKQVVFEKLWNVISDAWQNYNKILAVAVVGAQLADLLQEEQQKEKFSSLIVDTEWCLKLSKLGIAFQSTLKDNVAKRKECVLILVQNPNVNSELIMQYCSAFGLNSDVALQLYIETLLLRDTNGHRGEGEAGDIKQPPSELLERAIEVLPLFRSKTDLVISLSGTLHKMDPYNYEIIESALKIIKLANEPAMNYNLDQALSLLQHLYSYKRISAPGNLELQYLQKHSIDLSPKAEDRLPFHLLFFETTQRFWNIISAELSEETFATLLLISKLMKVSLDTLHMKAADHVLAKTLKPKVLKLTKEGCVSQISKEIAETVHNIQSYILAITNPEWATASSHRVAQELPTGPEKIQALKFCLQMSENWLKSTASTEKARQKAEDSLTKLRVEYENSATANLLRIHNLNSPEYLKLIKLPAKLICSLYEHSSIEDRLKHPTAKDYPDIHTAAGELAEINNRDINKIRFTLLEEYLCPPTKPDLDSKLQDNINNMQEDPALMRVIYLLQMYPVDYSAKLLFTVATGSSSPFGGAQLPFLHRSRALQCLLHIADSETIANISQQSFEQVKRYLKYCIYLTEFEILNIPYTIESFHSSPKEGMIKGLWKNHNHEPRAVRLVTELSLEYRVYDPQLWNGILQKLLAFNMINYLRKVLVAVTAILPLWQIPNFNRAWRSVILAPFLSASCPPSPKQLEACYESFVLLIKCPILLDLDLIGIAKQYVQLELLAFALGCLLLIPYSEKKKQQIQGFLLSVDPVTLLQQVIDHMTTGEVAGYAFKIKELALDSIADKKQYEKLIGTKFFPFLKQHMIDNKRVEELAAYLVERSCLDDALSVVTEYLTHEGRPIKSNISPAEILKEFLHERQ
ncbi:kinetochore-associated protein 1 [Carcharodon carcharias]|uniref:kinetochore-associated protein 1 n=1 Tax=Carcharodon carcharias TaxID=13397 RepID=UPI001B7E79FB|nr:kinetochore-associated protein 1 [Carcharodon carcharias]